MKVVSVPVLRNDDDSRFPVPKNREHISCYLLLGYEELKIRFRFLENANFNISALVITIHLCVANGTIRTAACDLSSLD